MNADYDNLIDFLHKTGTATAATSEVDLIIHRYTQRTDTTATKDKIIGNRIYRIVNNFDAA